jgi:TonB family protein
MSVSWKQCEGQVVNNTFPLQQYLGGSGDSAVFLTQLAGPQSSRAAIKLIPEGSSADLQLSLWRRASQFSHPNLIPLFQSGRCHIADMDLLYVVMEYAEEDLSQILPQRALTASEVREMFEPVLSSLSYLHGQGLVHSHIKPSNVLATGDRLKLSSDTIFPAGESRRSSGEFDIYVAPEAVRLPLTTACDVWSLGMTLVEALTQRVPAWQPTSHGDPIVPDTLPHPFLDIARHALYCDPKLRWTLAEIGARLNPVAAAAAAGQSVSPVAVPLSPIPAVPAARLQTAKPAQPSLRVQAPTPRVSGAPKQGLVLPNYVVPVMAAILVIVAIIALPKILGHRAESSSSASSAAPSDASSTKRIEQPARHQAGPPQRPAAKPPAQNPMTTTAIKKPSEAISRAEKASPSPASLSAEATPVAKTPKNTETASTQGDILDQVLPEISDKSRATIHGTVRVSVLVHVDAAGNVSQAEFDSPGPSRYFADLALKAARRWEFSPPEAAGRSVPSEWRVRFEFSQSGVKALPKQTVPQ